MPFASAKSIPEVLRELRELLVAYARQETVGPLKGLGRSLGLGLAGAVFVSLGVFLVALGVVRGMQTQIDVFRDGWNFVPLLGGMVVLLIAIALVVRRLRKLATVTA